MQSAGVIFAYKSYHVTVTQSGVEVAATMQVKCSALLNNDPLTKFACDLSVRLEFCLTRLASSFLKSVTVFYFLSFAITYLWLKSRFFLKTYLAEAPTVAPGSRSESPL